MSNKNAPQLSQKYMAVKMASLKQSNTRTIRGIVPMDGIDPLTARAGFVIFGCVCVQDSPENPCPCTLNPLDPGLAKMYWVYDEPNSVSATGETTPDGFEICDFEFSRNARLGMEKIIPLTVEKALEIQNLETNTPPTSKRPFPFDFVFPTSIDMYTTEGVWTCVNRGSDKPPDCTFHQFYPDGGPQIVE